MNSNRASGLGHPCERCCVYDRSHWQSKKLPELARGLGQGIREFRKAAKDVQDEVEKETKKLDEKDNGKPQG